MLQEDLLRQLLTDSKAYGTLLGSGGVGDPGKLSNTRLAFVKLLGVVPPASSLTTLPALHYQLWDLQTSHGRCKLGHLRKIQCDFLL